MIQNPHLVCAMVLYNLRVSGLTYSLHGTPFSGNIVLRKKYTKEFTRQPDFNFLIFLVKYCTPTATKQEPDTEQEISSVRNNLLKSESVISNLLEALAQLQHSSPAREEVLNTTSSTPKEDFWQKLKIFPR